MAAGDDTATFALRIEADREAPAEAADALEKYRAAIQKSQQAIAQYAQSTRLLRGDSDEVKDAKKKLKAAIEAERASITKANLEILKLGGSYAKLSKAAKDSKAQQDGLKKSIAAIGGPAKELTERVEGLKAVVGGATGGWSALAVGLSAGLMVVALAAAAIAGLTVKLTELTVTSGDSLRSLRLVREAVSGNTANATAWGHVVDWAALKLASSKDELNELVVSLEKSTRGTRVSGQAMVDTFRAVATTSAAMGKDTGKALEDILTRGKMTGRFWLGFKGPGISELQGTGISYQKVAEQLGKNLGIGTQAAKVAMMRGAVKLADGARAVREVVEGRFADVNAKKLLSLDSLWTKFRDNLRDFASDAAAEGGALEPLLKGLKSVVDMFGLQTESGQRTKRVVTEYSQALGQAMTAHLHQIKALVSAGLEAVGMFVTMTSAVVRFASSDSGSFILKAGLYAVAAAAGLVVAALAAVGAVAAATLVAVGAVLLAPIKLGEKLRAIDWPGLGRSIVDGLVGGIAGGWERLKAAVTRMGEGVKAEFHKVLGIASPSKVMDRAGRDTGGGLVQGIRKTTPAVTRASRAMGQAVIAGVEEDGSPAAARSSIPRPEGAPVATATSPASAPTTPGAGSRAASPGSLPPIQVLVQVTGGGSPQETAALIRSESTLGPLRQALRAAIQGAGVPVGVPTYGGG